MYEYNGQAAQDLFVQFCLDGKKNGYFLEIGSNDPIKINNSYYLETKLDWKGIMIEYDKSFIDSYKHTRPKSIHIFEDATQIDFSSLLEKTTLL